MAAPLQAQIGGEARPGPQLGSARTRANFIFQSTQGETDGRLLRASIGTQAARHGRPMQPLPPRSGRALDGPSFAGQTRASSSRWARKAPASITIGPSEAGAPPRGMSHKPARIAVPG
jgi:hypothetical protein